MQTDETANCEKRYGRNGTEGVPQAAENPLSLYTRGDTSSETPKIPGEFRGAKKITKPKPWPRLLDDISPQ